MPSNLSRDTKIERPITKIDSLIIMNKIIIRITCGHRTMGMAMEVEDNTVEMIEANLEEIEVATILVVEGVITEIIVKTEVTMAEDKEEATLMIEDKEATN